MYALSNLINGQSPSYRAVNSEDDALAGEIVVANIPKNAIWDATDGILRSMTEAELFAEFKANKKKQINAAREAALNAGISWNGYSWDSDVRSRDNITGAASAVSAGIPLPANFTWRTKGNQDVPITGADIIALAAVMLNHVNEQYARSWQRKAEVDAAATEADVNAVIW